MKLELKHLAPYLPYGLKVKKRSIIYNVAYLSTKLVAVISPKGYGEVEKISWDYASDIIKPILRPLSDLTKEIEHNGEKVVPIEQLDYGSCIAYDSHVMEDSFIQVYDDDENTIALIETDMMPYNHYAIIQQLFEWHFDVFGLIEAGLAIEKKDETKG